MNIIGYVDFKIFDENGNLIKEFHDTNNETIYAKWVIGNVDLYFDFVLKDLVQEFGMPVEDITKTCWNETNRIKSNLFNVKFGRDNNANRYAYNFSYLNGDKEQLLYGFLSRTSNNKLTTLFYLDEPFLMPVNSNIIGTYIIEYYTEPYSVTDTGQWSMANYTRTNTAWINIPISKDLRNYKYTRHFLKTSRYYGLSLTDTNIQSYVTVNINSINLNNRKAFCINGLDSSYEGILYYKFMSDGNVGQATALRKLWNYIYVGQARYNAAPVFTWNNYNSICMGNNTYKLSYKFDDYGGGWSRVKDPYFGNGFGFTITSLKEKNNNVEKIVDSIPVYPIKMYFPKKWSNEKNTIPEYPCILSGNAIYPKYILFNAILYVDELKDQKPYLFFGLGDQYGDINTYGKFNVFFGGIQCNVKKVGSNGSIPIYEIDISNINITDEYAILNIRIESKTNFYSYFNSQYLPGYNIGFNLYTNMYAFVGYNLWGMDVSNTQITSNWISSIIFSNQGKDIVYDRHGWYNSPSYGKDINPVISTPVSTQNKVIFLKKSEKDKIIGYITFGPHRTNFHHFTSCWGYLTISTLHRNEHRYYLYNGGRDNYSSLTYLADPIILNKMVLFHIGIVYYQYNYTGYFSYYYNVINRPSQSSNYYFYDIRRYQPVITQISDNEFTVNDDTYINTDTRTVKPLYETTVPLSGDYKQYHDQTELIIGRFLGHVDGEPVDKFKIIRWQESLLKDDFIYLNDYDTGTEYKIYLKYPIQQTENINSLSINFSTDSIFKTGEFLDINILDRDDVLCTDALEEWQSFSYSNININEADEYGLFPNQYIGTDTLINTNDYNNTDKMMEYTMPIDVEMNMINDDINYNLLTENQFQLLYAINVPNKNRLNNGNTIIIIPKEITYSDNNTYYTDISTLSITTGIHPINWTLRPVHEVDRNVLNIDIHDYWFVILDNKSLEEISNGEFNAISINAFINTKLSTGDYGQQIKVYYLDRENTLSDKYYIAKLELPFKINPHCNITIGSTTLEYCLLDDYGIDRNDVGSNIIYVKLPPLAPSSTINVNTITHTLNLKYNGSVLFTLLKKSFYYKYDFTNCNIYLDKEIPLMKYKFNVTSKQTLNGVDVGNYASINSKNNSATINYYQIVYSQYGSADSNFSTFPSPSYITIKYDNTKNPTSPDTFFPLYFTYKSDVNKLTALNGSLTTVNKTNDGLSFSGASNYGVSLPGVLNRNNEMWFECNIAGNTNFVFYGDDTTAFDPNKYSFKFGKSLNDNEKISHIEMAYNKDYNEIQVPNHNLSINNSFMAFNGDNQFTIPRYPITGSLIGNKLILYNTANIIGIVGYNYTSNVKIDNYKMIYKLSQQPTYQNSTHYYSRMVSMQKQLPAKQILINNYDCQKPIWALPNIRGFWLKDFLKNIPLKTTYAIDKGFDIKTYYLDINDFDVSYPRHKNSIFPNENINDSEIDIYVGTPVVFSNTISGASPIIDITNIRKIIGDSFELYDENNNKINYAFVSDTTTSTTATSAISSTPTNRIIINDGWISSNESQQRNYINYFNGNFNGVYYRSSSYYYPDNMNNSFIVDYDFINPRFNTEMSDMLIPLQYSISFIHNENTNNLKSWYLDYENLDSNFNINSIFYPRLTPLLSPLPLIKRMDVKMTKSNRGVAKYTIKKSTTPNKMNNAVTGIFTDSMEFDTRTNVNISNLILQKNKIPTEAINSLNIMKWHNIKAKRNTSTIKSIVILKLDQTNKTDTTQPIISKYYFVNAYNVLEDITDKMEKMNYQYIVDNGMDELTSLSEFNDIINNNKSNDNYQYTIQFGFIFGITEPDVNKLNDAINQFFGVSIYIDFVDVGMYKRLKWTYISSTNGQNQPSATNGDTIIIEPSIASWYLIDLNVKTNQDANFFNNTKPLYVMPISSMVNNASFGYKLR